MRIGIVVFTLFLSFTLVAQQKCGTIEPSTGEFENWISARLEQKRKLKQSFDFKPPVYQIPVVVHIFHKGEAIGTGTNLSDERIKAQIDSLTADFRRQNADAVNTPSDFTDVAVDAEIEFVLARQDPSGKPTNGIVRVDGIKNTYRVNSDKALLRTESYWPAEHYINIYVADLQLFLGYASFPVTSLNGIDNESDDFVLDAVFVDYEYFGNNIEAPLFESRGRTLTHEVGHFLGLRHIWGDSNCSGDDFVSDTPTARFDHSGTTTPCTYPIPDEAGTEYDDGNTCTEEDDPDLPDMFQNYLDYTDDICMNLFTQGQKNRMRIVLENSPRRMNLTNSPGLTAPNLFTNDLAITSILSPFVAECENQISPVVQVTNHGTNTITSYGIQLQIDGSPIGSPQVLNTTLETFDSDTVTFTNQTISSVPSTITFAITEVNGGTDSNSDNNASSVIIEHISNSALPFNEDFETGNSLIGSFGPDFGWEVTSAPKESPSNQALTLKAFNNNETFGDEAIFETPPLDLNGVPSATLSFSYAYADNPGEFRDGLAVMASADCGESYNDILFSALGPGLSTAASTSSAFTPSNQLDWMDTTIGISAYRDFDQVKFQFVGLNGSTNNIYVDNIVIQETNVLANDINFQSLTGPLVTCEETATLSLRVRNTGSENITSFTLDYELNGNISRQFVSGINIAEREYETFNVDVELESNTNELTLRVVNVNGAIDLSEFGNDVSTIVTRDTEEDFYPIVQNFESADNWINTALEGTSLWSRSSNAGNGALIANSFEESELGKESWFISPALSTGGLDSAGLYFRASYGSRTGLNDQLKVMVSTNCGNNYPIMLLDADADSLAITSTTEKWSPVSDNDWKEFRLDLSQTIPFGDEIRVAFVFVNGGGNDLYIDDIRIQGNEPPEYEQKFRAFPNPANLNFNLGFNLTQKEEVMVELINMSGKVVISETVPNVLNQNIRFEAPNQAGMYFIRVKGSNFTQIQKLFISPN